MAKKIIIGIHGLGNKPRPRLLEHWWKRAIREGLQNIGCGHLKIHFKMIYWADILHERPRRLWIRDVDHPLCIEEPYRRAEKKSVQQPGRFKKAMARFIEKLLDLVFLNKDMTVNFEIVTAKIIERYFKDLKPYYSGEKFRNTDRLVRDEIRDRLASVLKKHRRKDILLIAHSMGSVISYDVLTKTVPHINIHSLVTLGSPLGLPQIVARIFSELKEMDAGITKLKTPENILYHWHNLSDLEDKVALDHTLADDYGANSRGTAPRDVIIKNNFETNGVSNPHKAYGYVRNPEMSRIIEAFLAEGKANWLSRKYCAVKDWMGTLFMGKSKEKTNSKITEVNDES